MANLSESELQQILVKLGLESVTQDLDGLRKFYRAWCLGMPFDDLQKTLSLFENGGPPLPPLDARQFFIDWLICGTGGTCWQHSDALYTLAKAVGFDARRALASMFDNDSGGHGTVIVALADGSHWILDNAFLSMEPLRIDAESPSLFHGVFFAEVEVDGDSTYVHGYHPPMDGIFFRLIEPEVSEALYAERWSNTHKGGPFVRTAHVRRNFEDRFCVLRGDQLYTCTGSEMTTQTLDADGVLHHLRETFRIHPDFVSRWAASGALESNLMPPGPLPDLPQRIPPSKRTIG